jgi:alpha-galactosidase
VTDVPNGMNGRSVPLKFRFLVAMNGSLGLGSNLNQWTPGEMEAAAGFVAYYKRVRATVQRGALYRLIAPEGSEFSANEYVSAEGSQAVLFAFLHSQRFGAPFPTIFPRGLAEDAVYRVQAIDPQQLQEMGSVSGAYLMHHGIDLHLRGDYDSTAVLIEKLP